MTYQLAYVSLSQVSLTQAMLFEILSASQRNNDRDGITGILMYHDKLFFQVLEGERSAVEICYHNRTTQDTRHTGLSVIWSDFVESRTFSDWTMEYAGPDEIGMHTNKLSRSLADLQNDKSSPKNGNGIVLDLAKSVFA